MDEQVHLALHAVYKPGTLIAYLSASVNHYDPDPARSGGDLYYKRVEIDTHGDDAAVARGLLSEALREWQHAMYRTVAF